MIASDSLALTVNAGASVALTCRPQCRGPCRPRWPDV